MRVIRTCHFDNVKVVKMRGEQKIIGRRLSSFYWQILRVIVRKYLSGSSQLQTQQEGWGPKGKFVLFSTFAAQALLNTITYLDLDITMMVESLYMYN